MSPATLWAAVLIVAGTYAVIAFARLPRLHLDRPGAAVCGAVLMVFSAVTVVASNVVSNVPFVVLARGIVPTLAEPSLMWLVLAMASTLGGNLTIPGSVATLIVLETAKQHAPAQAGVSFGEFLRIGVPVTIVTTVLGALILAAEHWLITIGS